jgi:cytidine deaminase
MRHTQSLLSELRSNANLGPMCVRANVENRSFGLTICAERIAASAAVAAGEREFVAIAVTSDSDEPIVPRGACRQFLAEFNADLTIISARVGGDRKIDNLPPSSRPTEES